MPDRATVPSTTRAFHATVIVPTFNEADNLPELVQRIASVLPGAEVLVIDDASPDGTAHVARDLGNRFPIRVIERRDERGLSTAVVRGMQEASADVCVVMDADFSHPPERIPDLIRAVDEGADIAIGSRYAKGGEIDQWPLLRRLTSRTGTMLARPLTPALDPLAGFFCIRRQLLDGVALRPRGFKILLDILARARPEKIVEVPIRFRDREAGTSKFGAKERREYLAQLWELYRDLNAWPMRLLKFLITGASGVGVHFAVLCALVELARWNSLVSAATAFGCAMTWNYSWNRAWTFHSRRSAVLPTYARYALGTLAGLGVQLAIMHALSANHYVLGAALGIAAGTLFNYLASELWTFARGSRAPRDH